MAATGGDIIEINVSHPTGGSATLQVKSGSTSTFDVGGFRNENTEVDGNGNLITEKRRKPWMFEVEVVWDMNVRKDMEALVKIAESIGEATWDITHANGSVYTGSGIIDGDLQGDGGAASIPLSVKGSGKLIKQ